MNHTLNVEVEFPEEVAERIDEMMPAQTDYAAFIFRLALIGLAAVEAGSEVLGILS